MYYGYVSSPASNRADWIETALVLDDDTGDPIDLSLCRITMTLTNMRRNPNTYMGGYGLYGPTYLDMITLTGSTDTGEIVVVALGTFQWTFTASQMSALPQGEYMIGIKMNQDDQTVQAVIGALTVLEGIDLQ